MVLGLLTDCLRPNAKEDVDVFAPDFAIVDVQRRPLANAPKLQGVKAPGFGSDSEEAGVASAKADDRQAAIISVLVLIFWLSLD